MLNRRTFIKAAGLVGFGSYASVLGVEKTSAWSALPVEARKLAERHEVGRNASNDSALEDLLAIERWEDLLDVVDCRDVVQYYLPPGVCLKRLSVKSSSWIGPCPFCRGDCLEVIRSLYCCADCHVSGSAVEFVAHAEALSPAQALERLAGMLGADELRDSRNEYARFWNIMQEAADFYHAILVSAPEGKEGRKWAEKRGINQVTIEQFRLGYGPSTPDRLLLDHLIACGYTEADMALAGLIGHERRNGPAVDLHANDVFLLPLVDVDGHVWELQEEYLPSSRTRALDGWPNHGPLCSSRFKRMVWPPPCWPRDFDRYESLLVTHRPLDALLLRQAGFENVVRASWGRREVRTLRAMTAQIIRVQESPLNGVMMEEILQRFAPFPHQARLIQMANGKNLTDILSAEGPTGLTRLVAASTSIPEILRT